MAEEIFQADADKNQGGMGQAVSTMANQEKELADEDKNIFDWCKEGDLAQVRKLLANTDINHKDEEVSVSMQMATTLWDVSCSLLNSFFLELNLI